MDPDAPSGHDEARRAPSSAPPPTAGPAASWMPPDAGAARPGHSADSGVRIEPEDRDGPPLPPPVRRRRRRRRLIGAALGVVLIAVPIGFLIADLRSDEPPSSAEVEDAPTDEGSDQGGSDQDQDGLEQDGDDGANQDGGDGAETGETLARPDPERLSGTDALFATLLLDLDDAERVMIRFQEEIANVFSVPSETPQELIRDLHEVATSRRDALLEVRDRLDDPLSDADAEFIRARYLEHLDAWEDYLTAVAQDPSLLGGEGAASGFNVVINATADAFARALGSELPTGIDPEVRAFAEGILDRGFRGNADAQV